MPIIDAFPERHCRFRPPARRTLRGAPETADIVGVTILGTTPLDVRTEDAGQFAEPIDLASDRGFNWLNRPRRVLLALAAIWIINVFDLGYTLQESLSSCFVELNPLAARLIGASPATLIAYKTLLIVGSSTILLLHRRQRVTELACWLLLSVYLCVAGCWQTYYEHRLVALDDPAVNVDLILGCCVP